MCAFLTDDPSTPKKSWRGAGSLKRRTGLALQRSTTKQTGTRNLASLHRSKGFLLPKTTTLEDKLNVLSRATGASDSSGCLKKVPVACSKKPKPRRFSLSAAPVEDHSTTFGSSRHSSAPKPRRFSLSAAPSPEDYSTASRYSSAPKPRRFSLSAAPSPEDYSTACSSRYSVKRVRFAKGDCFEPPLVVVVSPAPEALTEKEIKKSFVSQREISKTNQHCTRQVPSLVWKHDKYVEPCLEFLCGARSTLKVDRQEWTHKQALQYFFSQRLPGQDAEDSTLRGLESYIAGRIVDQRNNYIHHVLHQQEEIQRDTSHRKYSDLRLAHEATRGSAAARQFALRLAKADRAVVVKQYALVKDRNTA